MAQPGRTEAAQPRYTTATQANRPLPSTVHRAVLFMRVGAGLAIANGLVAGLLGMLGWHNSPQAVNIGSANPSAFEAGYVIASALWFLIPAGLWFWMSYANKAGKRWARITGTVFFGVSCVGVLGPGYYRPVPPPNSAVDAAGPGQSAADPWKVPDGRS